MKRIETVSQFKIKNYNYHHHNNNNNKNRIIPNFSRHSPNSTQNCYTKSSHFIPHEKKENLTKIRENLKKHLRIRSIKNKIINENGIDKLSKKVVSPSLQFLKEIKKYNPNNVCFISSLNFY
mgnify:FL=1